ncbi:hypothetical protein [Nonomuraea sp. NPDC050786]|uniref:hypothetical protein n=1 Tax=Nonomuraea sp. NPDC050786 TaxID=3154840 RepID=UPI0033D5C38C
MATPVKLPDSRELDLDAITYMNQEDKLELIQHILDRMEADDADRWDTNPGNVIERIQKVLNYLPTPS